MGPGAFSPPPKVDSAVLTFEPLPETERPPHTAQLSRLLKLCFQQRRKQIGGILRRCGDEALLTLPEEAGLAPELRPEQLSVADFHRLSALLAAKA